MAASPPSPATLGTIQAYSFIITALVTVVGWFIVAKMADARDFRKEVREMVNETKGRAQEVLHAGRRYWLGTEPKSRGTFAVALKSDIMGLATQIRMLEKFGLFIDPNLVADVRRSATGGDFEQKSRRRKAADEVRMIELAGAIQDLSFAIDHAFYESFRPVKHRGWRPWFAILGLVGLSRDTQ
jgi:hypothetical protein